MWKNINFPKSVKFFPANIFSCFALNIFSFSLHLNFAKSFAILISWCCLMWQTQYNFDTSRKSDCTPLKLASSISTPILNFRASALLSCNSKANQVNVWSSFVKWKNQGSKRLVGVQNHFQLVSCFGNTSQLPTCCRDYTWYQYQELKYFDLCSKILQQLQLVSLRKGKRNHSVF